MNTIITFTPAQLVGIALAICASVVSISAAIGAIVKLIKWIRKPKNDQNKRIEKLEACLIDHKERFDQHEQWFKNDDLRLQGISAAIKVNQKSMLALLKHTINGNDIDQLKKAEKDLEEYLINQF